MHTIEGIVIIGSGNWGLALATVFCSRHPVRVWTIDAATAADLRAHRTAGGAFHKHPPPDAITIEEKFTADVDPRTTLFILAVPSSQVRPAARSRTPFAATTKSRACATSSSRQRSTTFSRNMFAGRSRLAGCARWKSTRPKITPQPASCGALEKRSPRANSVFVYRSTPLLSPLSKGG